MLLHLTSTHLQYFLANADLLKFLCARPDMLLTISVHGLHTLFWNPRPDRFYDQTKSYYYNIISKQFFRYTISSWPFDLLFQNRNKICLWDNKISSKVHIFWSIRLVDSGGKCKRTQRSRFLASSLNSHSTALCCTVDFFLRSRPL